MSNDDQEKELHEIMKNQMGMDPDKCDPVTLDLIRSKFFGRNDT